MPFKSEAQRKAMYAAAAGKSTLGIPKSVGKKFIEHADAAGIIFSDGKQVLLIKRGNDQDHPGEWAFPGGHREAGETAEQAAIRECSEEVGYIADRVSPVSAIGGFAAFATQAKFDAKISAESQDSGWFDVDNLPHPMHPDAELLIKLFKATELDIADMMQAGELPSPQQFENVWLFDMRVTGTGTAYRTKLEEFVYRPPEQYLNDEFLRRCNGLPVIWEHPEKQKLDSTEFKNRTIGTVFVPYIKGEEVWAICKIYDTEAAELMETEQLSTSPSVIFTPINDNINISIPEYGNMLIEGKPSLIDHLAVCNVGVWDKGGDPAGILNSTNEATVMADDVTKDDDKSIEQKDVKLDERLIKLLEGLESRLSKLEGEKSDDVKKDDDDEPGQDLPDEPVHKETKDEQNADKCDDDDAKMDGDDEKLGAIADSQRKLAAENKALRDKLAALDAQVNFRMTGDETNAIARMQTKSEAAYMAVGDDAGKCRPMTGERLDAYRKRMIHGLKKHSAKFKEVDVMAIADNNLLDVVEEQVFSDSALAARNNIGIAGGALREIKSHQFGREVTEFAGDIKSWMNDFSLPGHVAKFNDRRRA